MMFLIVSYQGNDFIVIVNTGTMLSLFAKPIASMGLVYLPT